MKKLIISFRIIVISINYNYMCYFFTFNAGSYNRC